MHIALRPKRLLIIVTRGVKGVIHGELTGTVNQPCVPSIEL